MLNKKAFTLVELIVVITILAILGTIAFISFQGYSATARDSVRIGDMGKINSSLELFHLDAGKYPETTDGYTITYTGSEVWTQGKFGETTFNNVEKLDKVPTDPLTGVEYIYSVTNNRQEYQIAGITETGEYTLNNVNNSYAEGKTAILKIDGNYNGRLIKVRNPGVTYILAVPSIITSTGSTLEDIIRDKMLAYNGFKNLPFNYSGGGYDIIGENTLLTVVNESNYEIFSGSVESFEDDTNLQVQFIQNLQAAYSGTDIETEPNINEVVTLAGGEEFLAQSILNNSVNKNVDIISNIGNSTTGTTWDDSLINNLSINGIISYLITSDNKLYIALDDGVNGIELWFTDGTEDLFYMIKDINPFGDSSPKYLTEYNGKVYFSANDGTNGTELWVTDGTESGTQMIKDINNGSGYSSPLNFYVFDGKLYFRANDGINGTELWVTDGTETGTQMIKDINNGSNSSYPSYLIEYDNKLYFSANDGINGTEIWITDGTESGTQIFIDINPFSSSDGYYKVNYNGNLYFSANDGTNGTELWVTDGTESGTQMLKDIYSGNSSSTPRYLTEYKGELFFQASNGNTLNGTELWSTDGTESGTQLFKDISITGSSYVSGFKEYNGKLYFIASDGGVIYGSEIRESDGTEIGTNNKLDLNPGTSSSSTNILFEYNGFLYFIYNYGEGNDKLYKFDGINIFPTQINNIPMVLY